MIQKIHNTDFKGTLLALAQALGIHLAFLLLFVASSWNWQAFEPPEVPVRVSLVDMGPTVAEREQAERDAQRRARLEAERQAEEQARREAEREAEEQARREAERQAQREAEEQARREAEREAEQARQREQARREREAARQAAEERAREEEQARERELAEIRAQREAAQKAREAEEAALAELADQRLAKEAERREREAAERLRLANEQAQADARRATLREEYILTIQELIRRNWTRPPTTNPGMTCTVRVFQIPGGDIISSELVSPCNADQATRRSIETAINRVNALPYRGYESVFEREIEFGFRYDG
ncbi:MAG: cell envelope integrity protein TolA [Wenzhouxiangella sp.]|nr:cell envelope integrity protein TolA [Wenzhouxiangella sp.]MDR9452891.1 cell envelope integrity protein TolA [Wenzhouxiangella sp.]